jgi:hypothetical protein
MPAENLNMRARLRTEGLLGYLESLREAIRSGRRATMALVYEAQRFHEGGLIQRPEAIHLNPCVVEPLAEGRPDSQVEWHHPTPGRQDCPVCRELPSNPVDDIRQGVERVLHRDEFGPQGTDLGPQWIPNPVRQRINCHTFGHGAPAGHTCTCGRGPWCACGFCRACQGVDLGMPFPIGVALEAALAGATVAIRLEPRLADFPIPIGSDSPLRWGIHSILSTGDAPETRAAAPSYTVETAALEAIREVMAPAELLEPEADRARALILASYRPLEGPTAACSACPALVPPEELWVGKKSGIALCDPCMTKWEKAGRARRTGEF